MHRNLILAATLLALPAPSRSQALPPPTVPTTARLTVPAPAFDVVSVAPSNAGDTAGSGIETHEATFTATNADLTNLLINAFDIKPDLIVGLPSWSRSARWDLRAKVSDPDLAALKKLTPDQRRGMLEQVMADRFHLKTHFETRELPLYNLVVLPHGPKFKPSSLQDDQHGGMSSSNGEVTLTATPLVALAYTLSGTLQRPVLDRTGLTARYDLHLKWAPEDPARTAGADTGQPDNTGPSLFSAIQDQLGLKLVPGKGLIPTLVIDHVDPPTPN